MSEEDKQWLYRPISVEELMDAIKSLPNGKTPGTDGLPCEFYKTFAEQLAPELLKTFTTAREEGELPPSVMEVVITLI